MFEYYYNGESHLGCIRHFGEFQGAESTIAMLTTQSQLPEKDKGTVEILVFDFTRVTSATLQDTDGALHRFLNSQYSMVPINIRVFRLYDGKNPNTAIRLERSELASPMVKQYLTLNHEPQDRFSKQELFDTLGLLDIEDSHKILDDDHNWLTAPKNSIYKTADYLG